ncbi:XkdX family protein [Paenibacillus sp. 1-18]|nr:XkdX family protein [Paenibacillus sp. 1-18]
MNFRSLAFKLNWVTVEKLKGAVKTEDNPFGEISPEEYKEITGVDFQ